VYASYQIESGAQVVQLFDSWAHHLSPEQFATFSMPYADRVVAGIKARHPETPVIFHANGGTGKFAQMKGCGADVIGLDWACTMEVRGNRKKKTWTGPTGWKGRVSYSTIRPIEQTSSSLEHPRGMGHSPMCHTQLLTPTPSLIHTQLLTPTPSSIHTQLLTPTPSSIHTQLLTPTPSSIHTQFDSHPVTHTHTQFDSHPVTHTHTQIYTHTHTHTHIRIFQEARAALGPRTTVQGNVDPMVLFGTEADIRQAVATCLSEAGPRGHILNVGHGVAQGTPEENVKLFCQLAHESGAFFKAQAEGAGKVLA
jgi:hypothetical protein